MYYTDKFTIQPWIEQRGLLGNFRPGIAKHPELNHE